MRFPKLATATILVLLLGIASGCSDDGSDNPAQVVDTGLNDFIIALPGWQQPSDYLNSASAKAETITQENEPVPDYRCDTQTHDWAKADNEVFAPEQDFSSLWPGAIFQGRSYRYGSLERVDVPRAPITVFSNLPGSKSVNVADPNSVSMNDAVNEIRGSVSPDAYQSEWEFRIDEVYSNLQGTMHLGLNAGYGAAAAGALSFSESKTVERHVFFGRAVQRMYTIRFADDELVNPADLFAAGVTPEDLKAAGIEDSNVPVYVRSITYGQMIIFKGDIKTNSSGQSFEADFKAAWKGFTGGGSGGSTGSDLLKQATYEAIGYGGDPGNSANAHSAVKDQKFGVFFDGATVQNAVPLFFEVVTAKDGEPAKLGERVTYTTQENCVAATGYTFKLDFRRMKANAKTDEKKIYMVELSAGVIATPRGLALSNEVNFPVANKWYGVNKIVDAKTGTNPLTKFRFVFAKLASLGGQGIAIDYPFKGVDRNAWLEVVPKPKETMRDGILPISPERTITADIWVRLEPTYD